MCCCWFFSIFFFCFFVFFCCCCCCLLLSCCCSCCCCCMEIYRQMLRCISAWLLPILVCAPHTASPVCLRCGRNLIVTVFYSETSRYKVGLSENRVFLISFRNCAGISAIYRLIRATWLQWNFGKSKEIDGWAEFRWKTMLSYKLIWLFSVPGNAIGIFSRFFPRVSFLFLRRFNEIDLFTEQR